MAHKLSIHNNKTQQNIKCKRAAICYSSLPISPFDAAPLSSSNALLSIYLLTHSFPTYSPCCHMLMTANTIVDMFGTRSL